jgi:hypothetical protein
MKSIHEVFRSRHRLRGAPAFERDGEHRLDDSPRLREIGLGNRQRLGQPRRAPDELGVEQAVHVRGERLELLRALENRPGGHERETQREPPANDALVLVAR